MSSSLFIIWLDSEFNENNNNIQCFSIRNLSLVIVIDHVLKFSFGNKYYVWR